ncbi:MAG: CHAD domain-containing protein [Coriobacteriales bacterium]|nr:CHAD domain-containing protein [Coriobacteriales bacterium]
MTKTSKATRHGKATPPALDQQHKYKRSAGTSAQRLAPGPAASDWDTLLQLQATIAQTAEAIEERRAAFVANPNDVETIHRFRTKTRTLRSLIAFIKPWHNKEQNAQAQAILKEIVGYTSRLRELDVLEKHVRANPGSSSKLIAFCAKEAADERAKVLKALMSKRVTRLFQKAMFFAKSIRWKKRYAELGLSASVARARFDALVESVRADLADLDLSDAEQTHDVRKRAKRARYVAEFCGDVLGSDAVDVAKSMNVHQDTLGDVCDARANIRLLSEFLKRDLPKSVARELIHMRTHNEALLRSALKAAGAK